MNEKLTPEMLVKVIELSEDFTEFLPVLLAALEEYKDICEKFEVADEEIPNTGKLVEMLFDFLSKVSELKEGA